MFDSLSTDNSSFKILHQNPQSIHQTLPVNTVTTERHLKFGSSITADWMENDQLSTTDVSQGDE